MCQMLNAVYYYLFDAITKFMSAMIFYLRMWVGNDAIAQIVVSCLYLLIDKFYSGKKRRKYNTKKDKKQINTS